MYRGKGARAGNPLDFSQASRFNRAGCILVSVVPYSCSLQSAVLQNERRPSANDGDAGIVDAGLLGVSDTFT